MKRIFMEYPPYNGHNELYDGSTHSILPQKLYEFSLGGVPFYLMSYYDETKETQAATLLTTINRVFVKVPLDNYDLLDDIISGIKLKPSYTNFLPDHIYLGSPVPATALLNLKFQGLKDGEMPNWNIDVNYAYNRNDPFTLRNRFYDSGFTYLDRSNDQCLIIFSKTVVPPEVRSLLVEKLRNCEKALKLKMSFELEVSYSFNEGRQVTLRERTDSRSTIIRALMMPGNYTYKFYITPCKDDTLDASNVECRGCTVYAPIGSLEDLTNRKKAFAKGFKGTLPTSFDRGPSEERKLKLK